MKHLVYLGLGTNLGNMPKNLEEALTRLQKHVDVIMLSDTIETAPQYVLDQPFFLNQVVKGKTTLSPHDLLAFCKDIEKDMKRLATIRNGPRIIDIDIISYDDIVLSTPTLIIPHPRFHERLFVLEPLAQIEPAWICPKTQKNIQILIETCRENS